MATGSYKKTNNSVAAYGENSKAVLSFQKSLNQKNAGVAGYTPIAEDGKYGDQTKAAASFQAPSAGSGTPTNGTTTPTPTVTPRPPRPIYGDEPPLVKERSVDDIQEELLKSAQGEIDSLNSYYESLKNEARIVGEKNMRSTNSISVLTGLGGSSEASEAATKTDNATKAELGRIDNEKMVATMAIMGKIKASAVEQARNSRLDARKSEEDRIAFREKAKTEAVENLTLLSKSQSGATLEGLKATLSPEEYDYLVTNSGGEAMAKAILFENRPVNSLIGKVEFIGGQAVQQVRKPDGSFAFEKIELPPGVQPNALVEKTQNGLLYSNDGGNTWKKVFGPGESGSGGSGGGIGEGNSYGSDLEAIIGSTIATIPTKFGQEQFQSQLNRARNDSDKISLVASVVLKNSPSEVKNDFRNQAVAISNLDKAIKLIDEKAKTGVLKSSQQYLFNLAGKDYDPNLAAISAYITAAVQPYRNSVTGAAWGNQEEAEYQNLFGSIKYSPAELKDRLTRVKGIMRDKSAQGLNAFVNPIDTYDNYFNNSGSDGPAQMILPDGTVVYKQADGTYE